MNRLAPRLALAASIALAVTSAPTAYAGAPEQPAPPPAGTVTTVRGDCAMGPGTIRLTKTWNDDGSAIVDIAARRITNGRWRGVYSDSVESEAGATRIRGTVTDHSLDHQLEVDGGSPDAEVYLTTRHPRQLCLSAFFVARDTDIAVNGALLLWSRQRHDELVTAGMLTTCRNGSRWHVSTTVELESSGSADAGGPLTCRHHHARIPRSTTALDGPAPTVAITLVVRSHGKSHRLSYRTEAPAAS